MSAFEGLSRAFAKVQFDAGRRIEFYETVSIMLENGVTADDLFEELYQVWSDYGDKPTEPLPMVAKACHSALANGLSMSSALSEWIPEQEAAMIATGEKVGDLQQTLREVIKLIGYKQRIRGAVISATAYPVLLSGVLGFLLQQIAVLLVPQILRMASVDSLSPVLYTLYLLSMIVTNYGMYIVFAVSITIALVFFSLPRLTGSIRVKLDYLPIYRTYRILNGSTFLMNVALMMRSGEYLKEVLLTLSENSNDWMHERIMGTLNGINSGDNLGVSLANAGHNFPDKRSIQMLTILAGKTQFEEAMVRFSERWLEQTIRTMEASAKVALYCSIFAIFALVALIFFGVQEIQTLIDMKINSQQL